MSLSTEKVTEQEAKKTSGFQEDLEFLRQAPLLRGLDYECLKLLAMLSRRITFITGDQLMVQGEDDGHAFLILSGRLNGVYTEGDTSQVIRQYEPGMFVGGCALLGRIQRLFTLQATEETMTLRLSREEFRKTLQQFPAGLTRITGNLVSELVEWDRSLLDVQTTKEIADYRALGVSLL
ncbi:MAG: cyclic nucleotide-binding domain-containing protein [Deltaproteobacteria bacterium]|nr:cyclic nucleotide-binding domain-containing protein [Deltaproteobacteria bacterium]